MSVKHNEKGAWPKVCIACADNGIETILNPGINCYLSLYKNGTYKCTPCKSKQSQAEHIVKYKLPHFRAKKIEYLYNYHREEPAGIYAIYYDLDIIYIGESALPEQRRIHHFTKHIKSKEQLDKGQWQSNIQYALATGELDRKRLSFEVMEYEQDKAKRLILEKKLIQEHFNTFGEYPKYQLNHTGVHNGKKRKE
jgi:hypothetical protein